MFFLLSLDIFWLQATEAHTHTHTYGNIHVSIYCSIHITKSLLKYFFSLSLSHMVRTLHTHFCCMSLISLSLCLSHTHTDQMGWPIMSIGPSLIYLVCSGACACQHSVCMQSWSGVIEAGRQRMRGTVEERGRVIGGGGGVGGGGGGGGSGGGGGGGTADIIYISYTSQLVSVFTAGRVGEQSPSTWPARQLMVAPCTFPPSPPPLEPTACAVCAWLHSTHGAKYMCVCVWSHSLNQGCAVAAALLSRLYRCL